MRTQILAFLIRRIVTAVVLVLLVASAAMILARLAPGGRLSPLEASPEAIAAERARLCLDCPLYQQYAIWARHIIRLDLGESSMYPERRVSALIAERAGRSAVLGCTALLLATIVGIPLGILTASRQSLVARIAKALSILLLAVPSIVLSLALLLLASRTGWLPVGGLPGGGSVIDASRYLVLPVLALALPIVPVLERLQSRALADALADPAILAARARGLSRRRIVWRHALRLSLKPVLAVYGVIVGALLSGSFVVEYVMSWPGLGRLMYDALVYRDANLAAGCAAAGAAFLAFGILLSDIALAAVDPRLSSA